MRGEGDQLRDGGARRQPPGMAGVHTAEQRLHQPVDHLVAEPARHQVTDRDVVVERRGRAARPRRGPAPPRRGRPDSRSSGRSQRHAHHRARQRPQRAAGPDPRRLDRRVHDLQPELAGQRDAFRTAVEHRLRADVDHHAADLGPPELAAGLGRRLEHRDLVAVRVEDVGRGQPGQPTAHHQNPHGPSLADLVPPRPGAGRGGTRSRGWEVVSCNSTSLLHIIS